MMRASHLGAPTRWSTMLEGTSKAVYPMKKMAVPIAYTSGVNPKSRFICRAAKLPNPRHASAPRAAPPPFPGRAPHLMLVRSR